MGGDDRYYKHDPVDYHGRGCFVEAPPVSAEAFSIKETRKTYCYIDGYNLYCGFFINRKIPNPPADKWLNLRKLLTKLLSDNQDKNYFREALN